MLTHFPSQLSDSDLLAAVTRLATCERRATVALIAHLAELDARKLYRGAGFASTFVYCTRVLRLSEGGAYNRIEAARAARKYPRVLDLLETGALTVATVRLLAGHLTPQNHEALFEAASHKSKRDVEEMLAHRFPKPDVATVVRKLPRPLGQSVSATPDVLPPSLAEPEPSPVAVVSRTALPIAENGGDARFIEVRGRAAEGPAQPGSLRHPLISPLSPDRFRIQFTASAATCEKLRLAQDLLRHAIPNGDPAEIFDRALTALLKDLGRRKLGAAKQPRAVAAPSSASRNIPAHVKRAVVARDGAKCAFVAASGHRCAERAFLEFHHVVPYARGGPATETNIQLRCRTHNGYDAEAYFGQRKRYDRDGAVREGSANYGASSNSSRDELIQGTTRAPRASSAAAWTVTVMPRRC